MTKLQEKFGGAAQKDLETYAGKQALVANAMDNLKEKIGTALIPVLSSFQDMMGNIVKGASTLVTDLGEAWKAFSEIPEVKKIAESLSGAFADLQKGFGTVADELGKTLMPIFKELWAALGDVWKALSPVIDAFGQVWKAITGVGKDGKEAYTVFNLIADVLKVTIVPALTALVKGIELVTPLIKTMADAFKVGIETILFWIGKLNEAFETLKKGFQGVSDFFTGLWDGLTGQAKTGVSGITDEVKKGTGQITKAFDDLKKEVSSESIWPDMWKEMTKDTVASMDEISGTIGVALVEIARLLEDQSPDLSNMLDPLLTAKVTLEQMDDVFGDLVDSSGSIGEGLDKLQAGLNSGSISVNELQRGFIELSTKISTSQGDTSRFTESISRCLEDMLDPLISAKVSVEQMHTAFGGVVTGSTSVGGALDMLRNKFDSGEVSLRTLNEGFAKLAKESESGTISTNAMGKALKEVGSTISETNHVMTQNALLAGHMADGMTGISATVHKSIPDWNALGRAIDASGLPMKTINEYLWNFVGDAKNGREAASFLAEQFEKGAITIEGLEEALGDMNIKLEMTGIAAKDVGISAQTMATTFNSVWPGMQSIADSAMNNIVAGFRRRAEELKQIAQNLYNSLVGHSIWPDMWSMMVDQTRDGLQGILSETQGGLGKLEGAFGGTSLGLSPRGVGVGGSAERVGAGGPTTIHINVPITVQNMTGNLDDIRRLAREVSREVGNAVKWRR
jgi:methyl-accepting chemotaxis protein